MAEHNTYEIIPSGEQEKRAGWQAFVRDRDKGVTNQPNTERRLLYIHQVLTGHLGLGITPKSIRQEQLYELLVTDRPDGEEIQDAIEEVYGREWYNNTLYVHAARLAITQLCVQNTKIRSTSDIRGRLRSFGTRSISNGEYEPVYWSHSCIYSEDAREIFTNRRLIAVKDPRIYYGLSNGLDEVYAAMCRTYDELKARAGNLDELLFAEAFLQLVGTRVVHPLADGNGRVFATHLAYTLHQAGIQIDDHEMFREFFPGLTVITDTFITEHFLKNLGLGLISGVDHERMRSDHRFRQEYMARLRTGIEELIKDNIKPDARYIDVIANNRWQIRRVLVRNRLIKKTPTDQRRLDREEHELSRLSAGERAGKIVFIPYEVEMREFR